MSATTPEPLTSIYDAKLQCQGFTLNRGRSGYEAFDANTQSLGYFSTKEKAIAAVLEANLK